MFKISFLIELSTEVTIKLITLKHYTFFFVKGLFPKLYVLKPVNKDPQQSQWDHRTESHWTGLKRCVHAEVFAAFVWWPFFIHGDYYCSYSYLHRLVFGLFLHSKSHTVVVKQSELARLDTAHFTILRASLLYVNILNFSLFEPHIVLNPVSQVYKCILVLITAWQEVMALLLMGFSLCGHKYSVSLLIA